MAKWCIRCTRRIEKIIGFQSANGKPRSLRGSGFYRGVRERPYQFRRWRPCFSEWRIQTNTHARNIANAPFGPHDCDWIFGSSSANREPGPLRGSGFYRGVRERPLPISTMAAMFSESRIQTVPMPAILQTPRLVRIAAIGFFGSSSANRQPGPLRGSGFYRGVHERPLPNSTMAAMFFRMAHPNRTHARNIANAPFGPHDRDWIFGSSSANRQPGPLRGSGFYRGVHERPLPISTMAAMFFRNGASKP